MVISEKKLKWKFENIIELNNNEEVSSAVMWDACKVVMRGKLRQNNICEKHETAQTENFRSRT